MTLPAHHLAWLLAHPHRTERWFLAKLKEGFDVHHLDGDHENNDPSNLALIEHTDHMMVHNGGTHFLGRLKRRDKRKQKRGSRPASEPIESDASKPSMTAPPLFAAAGFRIEARSRGLELTDILRRGQTRALYLENLKDGDWVDGWLSVCLNCDRQFIARRDAIYCSDACRVTAYRNRKRVSPSCPMEISSALLPSGMKAG